jgi:hypothetical protein
MGRWHRTQCTGWTHGGAKIHVRHAGLLEMRRDDDCIECCARSNVVGKTFALRAVGVVRHQVDPLHVEKAAGGRRAGSAVSCDDQPYGWGIGQGPECHRLI